MDNLLYYPYINIPPSNWTGRALLYYDHIGTIVPLRYFHEPKNYEPFMRELVASELVIPIDPMRSITNPIGIMSPFLDYIKTDNFKLKKRIRKFEESVSNSNSKSLIHVEKFDGEIFYQLEHAGIAKRQNGRWYEVESETANELMSYLASVLGATLNYLPSTDNYNKRLSVTGERKREFKVRRNQQLKRELILEKLIPFPELVGLSKLRSFKDKYADLLNAFKNKIELIALDPDIEEGTPIFNEKIKELNLRKEELSKKMNESKLGNIIFGTVCGITAAIIGVATTDSNEAALFGFPGLVHAIYSALKVEEDDKIFDQTGMKYLALVDKQIRR